MTGQRYKDELVTGETNAASHYGPRSVESALPSEFAQSRGEYTVCVPFNAEGPHDLLVGDQASILIPDLSYVQRVWAVTEETFDDLGAAYDIGTATLTADNTLEDVVVDSFMPAMVPGIQGTHGIGGGALVGQTLYATTPGSMWQVTVTLNAGAPLVGSVNVYVTYSRAINDRADNFDA